MTTARPRRSAGRVRDRPARARGHGHSARVLVARGVLAMTQADKALFDVVHEDAHGRADGFVSYEIKGEWNGGFADRTLDGVGHPGDERGRPRRAVGVRVRRRPRGDRVGRPASHRRTAPAPPSRSASRARRLRQRRHVARSARPPRAARGAAVLGVRRTSRDRGHRPRRAGSPIRGRRERAGRAVHSDRRRAGRVVLDRDARCLAARREPLDAVRGSRPRARSTVAAGSRYADAMFATSPPPATTTGF